VFQEYSHPEPGLMAGSPRHGKTAIVNVNAKRYTKMAVNLKKGELL
jgi:hypothetical protein